MTKIAIDIRCHGIYCDLCCPYIIAGFRVKSDICELFEVNLNLNKDKTEVFRYYECICREIK